MVRSARSGSAASFLSDNITIVSSSPPPSRYPSKSAATLSKIDSSHAAAASTAVQYLSKLHNSSISPASTAPASYADSIFSSSTRRSGSDASSTYFQDKDGGSEDGASSSGQVYSEGEEDQPRHEKGWRGLNTVMPLSSRISATLTPVDSFDRPEDVDFIPFPEDPYSLRHSEYGFDENPAHRTTSIYTPGSSLVASGEEPALSVYLATYLSYAMLILVGHMRDFFGKWLFPGDYQHLQPHEGYAPLYSDFDSFYTRRLKIRIDDCFARPITSVASRTATLLERTSTTSNSSFTFTGEMTQALNVSSYNYLGFAQSRGACSDQAEGAINKFGVASAGTRGDVGTLDLHIQAERLVAKFLGVEDCMIVSMGFATNSTNLPALVSKGCLVISDELNHSSIRFGARLSGAMVRQYKHNDMQSLEALLREVISQGQPRTHRPWKKILVIVEGLYSMEGTLVDLPTILAFKEQYKFSLYIDEAHSVGALGPNGRGVCDYFGLDPRLVDILMGTFTKSFGAAGGYIAGSHALVSSLRLSSHAQSYAEAMPPPVLSQIITSMATLLGPESIKYAPSLALLPSHILAGEEGRDRLRRLAFNCRYLSGCLKKLGFIVFGHHDSPIVPLLVYGPGKMSEFSRLIKERYNIIVVVVAYPATSLCTGRVRFCLSSAHTKADLDQLLRAVDDVGSILGLKLSPNGMRMKVDDVIAQGVQMVRNTEYDFGAAASITEL